MPTLDLLRKIKSPLILFSLPVLGGAVYDAISKTNGLPSAQEAIPAIVALCSEMGMHLWSHELHKTIDEHRNSATDIVGVTLSALIDEAAADPKYPSADRTLLKAMAGYISDHWQDVIAYDTDDYADLSASKLPDLLIGNADTFLKVRALTPEIWRTFLLDDGWWDGSRYRSGSELDPHTVEDVADRLYTTFASALFKALVDDSVKHGEAYFGMVLRMLGEIRSSSRLTQDLAEQIYSMARAIKGGTITISADTVKLLARADESGESDREILERLNKILEQLTRFQTEQDQANRSREADYHEPELLAQKGALHQSYLARVIDSVGRLTLANINPQAVNVDDAPLEDIYVDLPTECGLLAEVKNGRIVKWWVARSVERADGSSYFPALAGQEDIERNELRFPALRCDDQEGLQPLIDAAQDAYLARRARASRDHYYNDIQDGVHTVTRLSAGHLVSACRRLVVLGGPGSGKSTLVRHLALCLAGEARDPWPRIADLSGLPGWAHGPLTPVYVELRRFFSRLTTLTAMPGVDHLWDYVRAEILDKETQSYAPQLEQALEKGRALLILDGLDEVPHPAGRGNLAKRQAQIRALVHAIDDHYGTSRIVVASRPYAYENWRLDGFESINIAPFTASERVALAANLYRFSGYPEPDEKARRLSTALDQQGVSEELADNPLFLTLMATIFARSESGEGLPSRKGALYRESVLLLLERWTRTKRGGPALPDLLGSFSRDALLNRLARLAYRVHDQYGSIGQSATPEIPKEWLFDLFEMQLDDPTVDAGGLLSYLSENAGLLVSPGHRGDDYVFRFAHRTFQEYLAAKHLVEAECTNGYGPVRDHIARQPDLWRASCLLVGDLLRDADLERDAFERLWTLIAELLGTGSPESGWPSESPRWWPVWLAASIAQEQQLYHQNGLGIIHTIVQGTLVRWLVKLAETAGALPPQERAHCSRILGLLGDPRRGVGLQDDVPEIVWGEFVEPGMYPIGGDKEAFQSLPSQRVSLKYRYRLSKYPVTNAQFQAFVDADAVGYNDPTYWTPAGLEWKGDRRAPDDYSDMEAFGLANHPRVNVSWYEAVAFCQWLSARYHASGLLDASEEISLPTQIEWEMCARGTTGRLFPYGDEFDALKGNVGGTGIGQTSAVGIFPDGASPYGVLDMSGNVWEWCLTAFRDGTNDASGSAARVLRGGAWLYYDSYARAGARYDVVADFWDRVIGFRVVCLPHSVKRF